MKVLHVGPVKTGPSPSQGRTEELDAFARLGVDGPSRSILGLARALGEKGVDVAVLPTKRFGISPGMHGLVRVLPAYTGRKYNPFISAAKWITCIEKEFGRPDLVNFHDVYDLFSVALARAVRRKGWRYIVTPRGGLREFAQQRDSYKKKIANPLFFRRYLRNAVAIHALAEGEAREIRLFDPALHTVVIPNGISLDWDDGYSRASPVPRPGSSSRTLGFIGQLFVEIKGLDLLLKAIRKLQETGQAANLKFVLVGPISNRKDERWLEQMRDDLPDRQAVTFAGPQLGEQKWAYLKSFDVFVLVSRTEGMPVAGLEAMACGKPCLFSSGTNMAELIEDGGAGWSCELTVDSILQRLIEIARVSDSGLRMMGGRARQLAVERFGWGVVADQYLAAVQRLRADESQAGAKQNEIL